MDVDWDPAKARSNLRKHGAHFADAEMALYDPFALSMEDPDSRGEQRFVALGRETLGRILVVVYAHAEHNLVRIISARHATPTERNRYEKGI